MERIKKSITYKGMMFIRFTLDQVLFVEKNYSDMRTRDICEATGLTVHDIYYLQSRLNVKKSRDLVVLEAREGQCRRSDNGGRFKKGHVTWNHGKKMPDEIREKVKHTFYTKGHLPHNTRKDFDIAIRKDKNGIPYRWIRISKGNWIMLHRYVWQLYNGEIPKGKIIVFKDGDHNNFAIDNLMMIDRKQHMKRNSFMNFPDDLRGVLQAKRVLTRIINQQKNG